MTAIQWDGTYSPGLLIESETDPWLEVNGERLVLSTEPDVSGTCGEKIHLIDGVLSINDEHGIQRCDACNLYDGDLSAARAYADHLNNGATVWFYPEKELTP